MRRCRPRQNTISLRTVARPRHAEVLVWLFRAVGMRSMTGVLGEPSRRASVPADAVGEHRGPNHAGVGLPTGAAAAAASGRAEHPDRADRRCRARPADHVRRRGEHRTLDRDREQGIGYNRFHTTAMCSPTRASLLTGRNHHRIGNGQIAELANDWDGYAGRSRRAARWSPRCSRTTATPPARSASGTTPRRSRRPRPGRSTTGRRDGLRVLLRVPGRRGVAVRAEPGAQHHQRPAAQDAGGGLPPQRGPRRRRDRLAAPTQGVPAGQAVLHVLGEGASTARTTS